MVYKNEVKDYVLICLGGGLVFGLLEGLIMSNMITGLISGAFFGVAFLVFMVIFTNNLEKKSAQLRAEIAKVRKIICEGPANHKKGANAIGGWLFLSEDAIEFYPHKMNIKAENIPFLYLIFI